jgi:hypothetical protein
MNMSQKLRMTLATESNGTDLSAHFELREAYRLVSRCEGYRCER